MEISIVQIGNSKGLRLPKSILQLYHISDKMELILKEDHIILKPISVPRQGWAPRFKKMHKNGDDALLMDDVFEDEIANWGE